ncbi:MAG: hypothetical protein ACYDAD_12730 [Acidimicrobiales bacterium]
MAHARVLRATGQLGPDGERAEAALAWLRDELELELCLRAWGRPGPRPVGPSRTVRAPGQAA